MNTLHPFQASVARKDILMSNQSKRSYFTSESVCAGHPDKIADRISDAILDAILAQDPHARTGIETIAGANRVELYGEINTTAKVDFEKITRETIATLGYTNPKWGFSQESQFENHIHQQSPEIAQGTNDDDGAGDQGMMFGFAIDETPELMPLPVAIAHSLTKRLDEVREKNILAYIRPDGKSQVTVAYENGKPVCIETVVIATAHDEETSESIVKQGIYDSVVSPILESYNFKIDEVKLIVNGTGLWHIPGPESDAGLTGRKIVVDTYGGYARVGGGAFSGKDPSKVDRSGAYAARYIAKNIVAKGLATKCEVGLAYVIGKSEPLMKTIDVFGTGSVSQEEIENFAEELIHCSVKGIVSTLDLRRPIYQATSAYGHFGDKDLPWEHVIS